jgi:hypothetical protein
VTVARALSSSRTVPSAAARNTPIGTVVPAVAVSEVGTTSKWSGGTTWTVVIAEPAPSGATPEIVTVPRVSGVHTRPVHDPELIENVLDAVTSEAVALSGFRVIVSVIGSPTAVVDGVAVSANGDPPTPPPHDGAAPPLAMKKQACAGAGVPSTNAAGIAAAIAVAASAARVLLVRVISVSLVDAVAVDIDDVR